MQDTTKLALSHFEIYVSDARRMEDFYTRVLGFVVTDRGAGAGGLIFLSRNPDEHHQIVLNPNPARTGDGQRVDHLSFRVPSLSDLRAYYRRLGAEPGSGADTVSHGSTWSIYFRDPEGNRLELFVDTPWYVNQPCRFPVDLELDDESLARSTEEMIRDMPGFRPASEWRHSHAEQVSGGSRDGS
ncbi:MAG: VOC family protein [Gammaproteobacteria bacterium]|nr:VOC family protein [Gammaproteobacteria bacterium]